MHLAPVLQAEVSDHAPIAGIDSADDWRHHDAVQHGTVVPGGNDLEGRFRHQQTSYDRHGFCLSAVRRWAAGNLDGRCGMTFAQCRPCATASSPSPNGLRQGSWRLGRSLGAYSGQQATIRLGDVAGSVEHAELNGAGGTSHVVPDHPVDGAAGRGADVAVTIDHAGIAVLRCRLLWHLIAQVGIGNRCLLPGLMMLVGRGDAVGTTHGKENEEEQMFHVVPLSVFAPLGDGLLLQPIPCPAGL